MKKVPYIPPELSVTLFATEDIITASGLLAFDGEEHLFPEDDENTGITGSSGSSDDA